MEGVQSVCDAMEGETLTQQEGCDSAVEARNAGAAIEAGEERAVQTLLLLLLLLLVECWME
jgi:hypothetical protein